MQNIKNFCLEHLKIEQLSASTLMLTDMVSINVYSI